MKNKTLVFDKAIKQQQKGVVILEAAIAVLIFSFGLIALIGLQANMMKNTSGSEYRTEAIFIAQQRMGMLWAHPDDLVQYSEDAADISTLLPGGKRTVVLNPPAIVGNPPTEVNITITWQPPGEPVHSYTTSARVTP